MTDGRTATTDLCTSVVAVLAFLYDDQQVQLTGRASIHFARFTSRMLDASLGGPPFAARSRRPIAADGADD
jgi:hypothetical protein